MTDKILQFPASEAPLDPLIGPFTEYRVVVDGRIIPNLTGHYEGDGICLTVDHRFGVTVPKELAYEVAWLLANAMAVGAGYPSMNAETKDRPFAPKSMQIGAQP